MSKIREWGRKAYDRLGLGPKENPLKDLSSGYRSLASHEHLDRNEDCALEDEGLYAVFDGMGGAAEGAKSSRSARKTVQDYCKENLNKKLSFDETITVLKQAILAANEAVYQLSQEIGEVCGTTCVLVYIFTEPDGTQKAIVMHVGDSRCYASRDTRFLPITLDDCDSWPPKETREDDAEYKMRLKTLQNKISNATSPSKDLSPDEWLVYAESNYISQYLGDEYPPSINVAMVGMEPGDTLLLCSDGLTSNLTDSQIKDLLDEFQHTHGPAELAEELCTAAYKVSRDTGNERRTPDDITSLIIKKAKRTT
jgi:PPM family protein phosphatase